MIVFDKFWKTIKEKNISQYKLVKEYKISSGLLDRLRKNEPISTFSINLLCKALHCKIEDIAEYIPDEE